MRPSSLTIDQISTDPGMGPVVRLKKFSKQMPDGCIEWTGNQTHDGYGLCRVRINGKWTGRGAHRVAYVVAYGFIPHYLQVHHKCYNRLCVNPDHLQLCTPRENTLDPGSRNVTRKNAEATSCVHGHPFNAENTYFRPTGQRLCRECSRRSARESARRKAAALIAASAVMLMLLFVSSAGAKITRIPHRCVHKPARVLCSLHFHAHRTNRLRLAARAPRIVYQWVAERHPARRASILALWMHRQGHAERLLTRYQRSQGSTGGLPSAWLRAALCVHSHEGSWTDPNAPYWGGMQMDMSFQASYGSSYLREYGTADHWPIADQLRAAYRAWQSRGWTPWPATSAMCGL